ncbi:MAG TPA: hypothetical protein VEC10_12295, partial [Steroidobacteraceae bacterium]|nr:hypothetical protein [Steroidobacteraceae bacterium]
MSRLSPPPLSRRVFVAAGAGATAGALLGGCLRAAGESAAGRLITKAIPASGERLPVIGLGTDAFRPEDSAEIRAEIQRMSELRGSVIDTAAAYGD